MRPILFCFFSFLLVAGCSKKDTEKTIENNGILGKWKLKEQFISPGAGGQWNKVPVSEQSVIEFLSNGKFHFSTNFQKANLQLDKYQLTGNELNMSSTLTNNTDKWPINYSDNTKLELSIFLCFEGCSYRFVPTL
jgi:uncharacterized protein (TIGR03066 family)